MAEAINLEPLRSSRAESGFLGVKVTTSGKFQAQLFVKAENRQRGLGTFERQPKKPPLPSPVPSALDKIGLVQLPSARSVAPCAAKAADRNSLE